MEPLTVSNNHKKTSKKTYDYLTNITSRPTLGHHGQEDFIGTKAAIAENLQLALADGIMANGPPERRLTKPNPANKPYRQESQYN